MFPQQSFLPVLAQTNQLFNCNCIFLLKSRRSLFHIGLLFHTGIQSPFKLCWISTDCSNMEEITLSELLQCAGKPIDIHSLVHAYTEFNLQNTSHCCTECCTVALKSALTSACPEVFSSLSDSEESKLIQTPQFWEKSGFFFGIQECFSSTIRMTTGVLAYCQQCLCYRQKRGYCREGLFFTKDNADSSILDGAKRIDVGDSGGVILPSVPVPKQCLSRMLEAVQEMMRCKSLLFNAPLLCLVFS